jgi:hypothetical protein
MNDQTQYQNWYFTKFIMLVFFLSCDLFLSSMCEFKVFSHDEEKNNRSHAVLVILITLLCLSSFTTIFSMVCDTFPFRVGLVGELIREFSTTLGMIALNLFLTILVGTIRVSKLNGGLTIVDLWESPFYTFFSFLRTLGKKVVWYIEDSPSKTRIKRIIWPFLAFFGTLLHV